MIENTGGSTERKRTQRDYSLAFKMEVIGEVEKGRLTYKEAQAHYGIQGRSTVLTWLRKHGTLDWQNTDPMKGKQSPQARIKELERRIKRLEAEKTILNLVIDKADEMLGADIRKKHLPLLRQTSGNQGQVEESSEESQS
jgi:transposase-like protein